jgi:hypothetical protein
VNICFFVIGDSVSEAGTTMESVAWLWVGGRGLAQALRAGD